MFIFMIHVLTVKPRPKSLHTVQIGRTDIKFTGVFYEVFLLFVALQQKQLLNCIFAHIWRNVYLFNKVMDE